MVHANKILEHFKCGNPYQDTGYNHFFFLFLFLSLFLFFYSTLILLSHLIYFQLVPVPRSPTVEDVLEQFGDYARTSGRNKCVIIHRSNLNN